MRLRISETMKTIGKVILVVIVAFIVSTVCEVIGGVSAAIIVILLHLSRQSGQTLSDAFQLVALGVAMILIANYFYNRKRNQRDANKSK
jgi:hypothetical protein